MEKSRLYNCRTKHAKQKFSLKVGTIFEDSPIGLEKWFPAFWLVSNCKNGVSSYEVARALGITQKSAWFMTHRIRKVLERANDGRKLGGPESPVEVDESFVGGKVKNMHRKRANAIHAAIPQDRIAGYETRWDNKTAVLGMFDRESRKVRAKVIPNVKRETLQNEILQNVKYGSPVFRDEAVGYDSLRRRYVHETVNHADAYVRGAVHTNCLENFWSLMKRNLRGTSVAVEPFHLDRYLSEQVIRFNNRTKSDSERFTEALSQVVGKPLTLVEVTGKGLER